MSYSIYRTTFIFGIAVFAGVSCGGASGDIAAIARVSVVTVGPSAVTVMEGERTTLSASMQDANGVSLNGRTVVWTSSATTIAAVASTGAVTGIAAGTATITATSEGQSATAFITVARPTPRLAVTGRVERGLTIDVVVTRGTETLPRSAYSLTVSPASGAEVLPSGAVKLLAAASLVVNATLGDGTIATSTITVAPPPQLLLDLLLNGNRDVYRVALDGLELTRLTTAPGEDVHPTASNGSIVFTSYRSGWAELFQLSADGSESPLSASASESFTSPAVSPDGRRLAYIGDVGGTPRLFTSARDGTAAIAVSGAASTGVIEGDPTWGSQSDRVIFMSTRSGNADLYTAIQGGGAVALSAANTSSAEVEPALSPDGGAVAFVSNRDDDGEIYLLWLATRVVTVLTSSNGTAGQPAWLPDGRLLYLTRSANGTAALHWIDVGTPAIVHDIALAAGVPGHPSAVR